MIQQATGAFQATWTTDKENLCTTKAEVQALEVQCHDLQRAHHQLVSDCKRQLRAQILGQEQEVTEHKIQANATCQEQWEAQQKTVDGLRHEYRIRRIQDKAHEAAQASLLLGAKKEHAYQIATLVHEYEAKTERVLQDHHRQVQALNAAADVKREAEIEMLARNKAAALAVVKARQHEELHDLKEYYSKTLQRQCLLLDASEAKLAELRRKAKEDDKHLAQLVKEHDQTLAQPLARARHALADLESVHAAHQEEKRLLQSLREQVHKKERRLLALERENGELELRFSNLCKKAERRRRIRQAAVLQRQQRADLLLLLRGQSAPAGVMWGACGGGKAGGVGGRRTGG